MSAAISDVGISANNLRALFGIGLVFSELAIIALSMLDRIGDTIKETLRPLARLVPLLVFLTSVWDTYSPLLLSLLPASVAEWFGRPEYASYSIAQAVEGSDFTYGVILTLVTMLFFVVVNYALGRPKDNAELRRLRAEVARYKKMLS